MPAENLWLAAAWPPSRDGCVHGVGSGAGGEQRLRRPGTSPAWFAALALDGVTGYFFLNGNREVFVLRNVWI